MTNQRLSCVAPLLLVVGSMSAQRQPIAESERSVHLYDVRDLLTSTGIDTESGIEVPQPLVQVVRAFLPVPAAQPGDIAAVGGSHLVAAATAEQHAWIERFLQRARQGKDAFVEIDATTLAIPLDVFARDVAPVLAKGNTGASKRDPSSAIMTANETTDLFLSRLREREGVIAVEGLQLSTKLLQSADIFVGEQRSYIKDFEVQIGQGSIVIDPIVGVIEDGCRLRCVAGLLDDAALGVVVESSVAQVSRPMAQVKTKIAGTKEEKIVELPRQRVARLRAALALPRSGVALLALPAIDEVRFLVVVRAKLIGGVDLPAATREAQATWTYDVGDLVASALETVPSGGEAEQAPALTGLAQAARCFVDPPLRSDEQLTAARPAHLVLHGRPAQQDWLRRLLAHLRAVPATSWTVKPQIVVISRDAYDTLIKPALQASGLRATASGGERVVLADAEAERVSALLAAHHAECADLAPVVTRRFETASTRDALRYVSYIRDFEVKMIDGKPSGVPVQDVVRYGPLLTWNLTPLPAGELGLAVQIVLMDLQQPIPKFTTTLGIGDPVTIDLPRVTLVRASAALTLPAGSVGVVTLPATDRSKQAVVFLHIETDAGKPAGR